MHAPTPLHLEETRGTDALLAIGTFLLGTVGLILIAFDGPEAGMACGAVGVVGGLWGQMISRTRSERFFDIIGLVASAVAFAVGAAQSGLTF
ncbi:MAG: hypothetical protein JWM02_566 [Frankiales bacterium]|nr:hypothetical protein [Frankiales bacterium]